MNSHPSGESTMDTQTSSSTGEALLKPISAASCPVIKQPFLKRPLDLALSSIGLLLSAPLWAMVAIAIKLDDGGPVFYTQDRWGRGAIHFKALKFRTMLPNADKLFGNLQATEHDDRITRVGRVLRATGMDELPQLLNIWKGDMSLVGPRALAVDEIVHDESGNVLSYQEIPGFYERLGVRPGLTSIATVYRPKDIHPYDKFRCDLLYIQGQSLWLDLRLIALSFWISFRGKWEDRGGKV